MVRSVAVTKSRRSATVLLQIDHSTNRAAREKEKRTVLAIDKTCAPGDEGVISQFTRTAGSEGKTRV